MKNILLRPVWQRVFKQAWILSIVLFIALGVLRAYGLFGPLNVRMLVMLNFFLMWFLPFVFFTRSGRYTMGLKRVEHRIWLLWGLLLGMAGAMIIFVVGYGLYGHGADNWYVSILHSWAIDTSMLQLPRMQLFLIYTVPAAIFSPIGEEFFFRGMIHASVREHWGQRVATTLNAAAFGGVHVLHHGLSLGSAGLQYSWVSGSLWILLMMGLSWVFTQCCQRSDSIWPAVVAHGAFNLTMSIIIFLVLF